MNKHDVSQYIRQQFPTAYEEGGEGFIAFVEAYYEYLDQNHFKNRTMIESIDLDTTLDEFVVHFKETYLKDFPFVAATDRKFMIKHILDFYKSKGSSLSTELLIRMLYGEDSSVNLPSKDILRASSSDWTEPEYIEVSRSDRTISFLDKEVVGSKSKAKATVEGIVTKRVNGKYIDVVYIDNVKGNFIKDEFITDDGNLRNAPIIVGSLTAVNISNGGRNNKVGDIFNVIGANGERGKVRVSEIVGATGRVDFSIVDGGFGYTSNADTDVYISDAILQVKNEDMLFEKFDEVRQHSETLDLISFEQTANVITIGDTMVGVTSSGSVIANGVVTSITDGGDGTGKVKLLVKEGTFDTQRRLTVNGGNTASFTVGDIVTEESFATIEVSSNTIPLVVGQRLEQSREIQLQAKTGTLVLTTAVANTFSAGEVVTCADDSGNTIISGKVVVASSPTTLKLNSIVTYRAPNTFVTGRTVLGVTSNVTATVSSYTSNPIPPVYSDKSYGIITNIAGNQVSLAGMWGEFDSSTSAFIFANSTSTSVAGGCYINTVTYTERGAIGKIASKTATTLNLQGVRGDFNVGNKVKSKKSIDVRNITAVSDVGAADVRLNGNVSLTSVISLVANTSATGKVIGQNTSSVGVWGNTNPFMSSGDISVPNTSRVIDALTTSDTNLVTIRVTSPHGYSQNDSVIINIDLQQNSEVKKIYGLYTVVSIVNSTTFRVQMDEQYGNIIRMGNFQFFTSTVNKTVVIPIYVERKSGENFNKEVYGVSSGSDANFNVGSLEGEETVFINTDFVGDENIVGVDYLDIRLDGSQSGIGFVGAINVVDGGTQYANGAQLTFTGGGYGSGEPEIVAIGSVMTNSNGAIIDVNISNMGQGYYSAPTITLPATSGTPATLVPLMEFGYGFPKLPTGGHENMLEDLFTSKEMTIGKISTLSNINPGINYNANPYVLVYNSYIAGFQRTDRIVVSSEGETMFIVGEIVSQQIPGSGGAIISPKGYVSSIQGTTVYIKRMSFNTSFAAGIPLVGQTSSAIRYVQTVEELSGGMVLGDNAIINATTIAADGIATELEVIDSGFGYEHMQNVSIFNSSSPFIMTGTAVVSRHGKSEGSWKSQVSQLDGNSRIHDNNYYQEFSYEVIAGRSMDTYKDVLKKITHVAGTKMFGKVEKNSFLDTRIKNTQANISRGVDNYSTVSNKLITEIFNNNERGVVLWPSYENWFSDVTGTEKIVKSNEKIVSWRSARKENTTKRKNLLVWTNDYDMSAWVKSGVTMTKVADGTEFRLTSTNVQHSLSSSFKTRANEKYTFSGFVKVSNHSRITVMIRGSITSGYITFNVSTGAIVARSGGYEGAIEVVSNGFYKISLLGTRAIASEGTAFVDIILNSNSGIGAETFNGSTMPTSVVTIKNVQVENGLIVSPYQNVRHGEEWDGIRYYQNKGQDFAPISSRMPISGIKNYLPNSDNFETSEWILNKINLSDGSRILGKEGYLITCGRDLRPEKHSLKRFVSTPLRTIGAVVRANTTMRYVSLSLIGREAVFDLYTKTIIRNNFQVAEIVEEDNYIIIAVNDSNIETEIKQNDSVFELTLMNGPDNSNKEFVGNRDVSFEILRVFGSVGVINDIFDGYTQENTNMFDVSDINERSILYASFADQKQRLISPAYENFNGDIVVGGINGTWFKPYLRNANSFNTVTPLSYEIIKAMGGIIGMVLIDRNLTVEEQNKIVDYLKLGGSKGRYFEEIAPTVSGMSLGVATNATISANTITKISDSEAIVRFNVPNGLYRISFDYQTLVDNISSFELVEVVGNGIIRSVSDIPKSVDVGTFDDFVHIENGNFGFLIKCADNVSLVNISNLAAYFYNVA